MQGSQSPREPDTAIPDILTRTFLSFTGALNFMLNQRILLGGRMHPGIHHRDLLQEQ